MCWIIRVKLILLASNVTRPHTYAPGPLAVHYVIAWECVVQADMGWMVNYTT